MNRNNQNIARQCKVNARREIKKLTLDDLIAREVTEGLMEKFNIGKQAKEAIKSYQSEYCKQTKLKEYKHRLTPLYAEVPMFDNSKIELRNHADKCPTTDMSNALELEIRKRVRVKVLERRYIQIINNIMDETRQHFKNVTHKAGVNLKVYPDRNEPGRSVVEPYKYLGRTETYDSYYLPMRTELNSKFLLHHELVRRIFYECVTLLPETLCNISNLRGKSYEIKELDAIFKKYVEEGENYMKKLHNKVIEILEEDNTKSKAGTAVYNRILKTCNGLISVYFGQALSRTIKHVVDVTSKEDQVPYLKLSINYTENLVLQPTADDLIFIYTLFIMQMVESADKFLVLEYYRKRNYFTKFLKIYITEEFVNFAIHQLSKNIMVLYEPIAAYVNKLDSDFSDIYKDIEISESLNPADATDIYAKFNFGCEQIWHYQDYIKKASSILTSEYFAIGQLILSEYVLTIKESLAVIIESIFSNLCDIHITEDADICQTFEDLKTYALTKPSTTESLIEQGKYMIWAKTVLIHQLRERIELMLTNLTNLVEFGTITKEHLELNAETVHWLINIEPILEINSSMYEQIKFEYEERLQSTIRYVDTTIEKLIPMLGSLDDMDDFNRCRQYVNQIKVHLVVLRDLRQKITWIVKEQQCLGFTVSIFKTVEQVENWIYPFFHLIKVCMNIQRHIDVWLDGPFEFLDYEDTERRVDDYMKELLKIQKTYRMKLRQASSEDTLRFFGAVDDPDLYAWPSPLKLTALAIQKLKDFRPAMTLMRIMCNDALMKRHWKEMSLIAGFDLTPNAGTSLRKMTMMGLEGDLDKYDIISSGASKERELYRNLQKMQKEWDEILFKTGTFKDTGINILTQLDDIQVVLDDHILKALTMRGSIFVKPYEAEVRAFYFKLTRINSTLDEWGKVQSQWLYLLPIFSSKDIVAQMPEEGILFKEVNDTYKRYMDVVMRDPRVFVIAGADGVLEIMKHCNELLEKINEGVTAYLEKKRLYFPRFFFLSNDEMLEILSETKDPLRVQPHLKKCFEAINKLDFTDKLEILAMFSQENEKVNFKSQVNTKEAGGSVEKWLVQVEEQMVISVRDQILKSCRNYFLIPRTQWVQKWPGQVVLCVSQMHWTSNVHKALNNEDNLTVSILFESLRQSLNDIVALIRDPTLTNLSRITIKALIVIDVHAKDVVEELLKKNVNNDKEFKWLSQMRYYLEEDEAYVRLINATVRYAYEYLGNSDRLVITPLTDRCYRTLIGAYHLHLNGAPEGPAGTGKTETTKDLAKAIAVQCVVFNCSDGLDYKAMGKFFKGLASCGAWACFDEFNRIDIEVLSVVAQQILSIILAVRAHVPKFNFEGTEISLNPSCYVCITMNPGYAGRTELPDNLKVLFRTVAMMVPDYAMIGEISLYSYGFVDARNLSVKIVTVYRLCSEQLSSQNHYDYGMRAVKSVLSAAGNNKRKAPDENEDILLLRAILDVNLPKFLNHDLPLFDGIISDLFPGVVLPEADYTVLTKAMVTCAQKRNLQPRESFLIKIIQTYEMMIVRHGFMVVGYPLAGKTSTLKVLADSLTLMNKQGLNEEKVEYLILNPKAITMGQLYGQFDPISYEWTDGVVATGFRNFATDPSPNRKWIIFDGPVDAVWIENMNSVLDDNKKLCLMSGEVMSMTNCMSLIFEVMDLEQASPATVSRCGMIYMQPETLGWRPFVDSWLPTCNPEWCGDENRGLISDLFDWIVPPCLEFIKTKCVMYCNPGDISLVKNMMSMVEMLLNDACSESTRKQEDLKNILLWIQAAFIQAGVWGIASILDRNSREMFDEYYKQMWRGQLEEYPYPESMQKLEISLPSDGILLDYSYNYKMKGNWRYIPDIVKSERVDECKNILQALIPTVDTVRYMDLITLHIKFNRKLLLIGPTGTGKSFYTHDLLMNKLNRERYEPAFITFTVQITCNQTQDLVISKLNKKKRGHYGPPKGKSTILFIDDVNMPLKEEYGAQPPLELLRQFFDHKNWYDLRNTQPIYLHDVLFIGAMGLVGGSRQDVYPRFLHHFSIFSINEFSEESMSKIYSNILLLGWKNNGFPAEIINTVFQSVAASLDMFKSAIDNLRPTPSKSHYVFNLRDFSRLIQGCAMLKKESAESKKTFVKIWAHEVLRVFYDRLIEDKDKEWVYRKLRSCIKDNFKEYFDLVFDTYPKNADGVVLHESIKRLMFGTYFDQDSDEDKRYEEVENIETFKDLSQSCLEEYNATHKTKMDVILFDYALEHLSKICRVLSMNCGSALLVGISGSGRQSLTRLGSEIYGHTLFQPEITNNYSLNDWRDDIKKILKECGGKGKHSVFLISEGQIKEESYLQDVDCLLNLGEVPNIYQIDEKQEILDMVRLAAQGGNRNLEISPLEVFFFFTKRCKERLHIILCFSPVGSTFRKRLRLYPSLINCCTIDWFQVWPEEALIEVAENWMADVNLSSEIKKVAVSVCQYFHVEATKNSKEFFEKLGRKTYITSASYLELIRSFTELTNRKQNQLMAAKNRYLGGLEKLHHAAVSIGEMQTSLAELQPQLKDMSDKATIMLNQIEKETLTVEKISALVRQDEKIANKQAAAAQALKLECEADLAEALPILNDAISALDTLKPADITLVKSMKNPPDAIKLVMAAVCIIKGVKPDRVPDPSTGRMLLDFWAPSKRVLGDMNFLQALKDFDKDNIKPEIMAKLRKEYIPHKDFKPHIVAKASSAAEGLCKWIIAMDMYDKVYKIVAPKKAKLQAAEKEFAEMMEKLTEKRNEVQRLEKQLAELNEKLDVAVKKQRELQDSVDLCNNKLLRAQKLIGGLGGEKSRWTACADALQVQYDGLAGDILISCGIISYLSPFNSIFRQRTVTDWHRYVKQLKIPCAETYEMVTVLGSDVRIQQWYINGLPRDSFSTENGIIMDNSRRWSLFVDPQAQASNWIKKMERINNLEAVKFSFPDYMKKIEMCVQLGYPVIIESVDEELEAAIDPLLFKKTFKQGGIEVIGIGENVIEYNKNFRLYLTSKLRNPHYLPEVFNRVTIINFALTLEGLQDQLLGIVVAVEKPELQQLKEELIVQKAENKAALENTEEKILKTLSECKGDILEDETAIQILDDSKLLSTEIREKQVKSLQIEKSIEEFRVKYQEVAEHSAVLYYCISDLANVDPMYQYSLEWFINLYISSIQRAEKFRSIERRCQSLINAFTFDLYNNITRSLFEKDKLLFSFLLCSKIMIYQNKLDEKEFMFFLTGGVNVENPLENSCKEWLPDSSWDEICRLDELPLFKGFKTSFIKDSAKWKNIYDNFKEDVVWPEPWHSKLNTFGRLIIIRILRADKLKQSITSFVKSEMDERFIRPPPFNISLSYDDSYNICPLVFILSPGTDPMSALVKFAEEKKMTERFRSISLGQGQGPMAQALIEEGQDGGLWVCLQNCHLATSWMPSLEKIFESLDYANTHDNFRLWLTSYPSNRFPVSILQRGVKMTNEPPTGLQNNLLKSYINDPVKNPVFYDGCENHKSMFARLLYGLAFFHAVVQERRTFGPLGWNIPYGFNDSDFDISVQQLQMFINESENPFEALSYLIGECNYGGRVTDDWDRRLIVTILYDFLNPNLVDQPDYVFSTVGTCYGLPEKTEYSEYVSHIRALPPEHPPEIFGLHTNAGITRDLQDSRQLLNSVLKAYGESSGGGAGDSDKYIMILCSDILSKLPKTFNMVLANQKFPVEYSESMNTVLVQEMERFNKLLNRIKSSLTTMQKALNGLVAMSPELEAFSMTLLLARIPASWSSVSYPSLKNLPNYVADFINRINFLEQWSESGKPPTYWVSGFFFTQAFLTGVKQNFARKYTIPIDKLTFDFEIKTMDYLDKPPKDGAYINGLFSDGARWDRYKSIIDELLPKVLHDVMPLIWIIPIRDVDYNPGRRYISPVYKTSARRGVLSTTGHSTNYVLPILLDTVLPPSHWIKRSMALLCQLD
ncbi:dynein heavy chain 12, axonemal [Sitophilus oryzae]|uniref:Dynein heavy chain 12, axonemal n=1 Tax=Sitophilus oryzae TaxID=7048 RepID=A0A6J2YP57_SITOR|nr:dynein heavy chain 12, axonemal [Sitophilus oryzae]